MAIDFNRTFGIPSDAAPASSNERPTAQVWMNIGVEAGGDPKTKEGARFVSLPLGVPLDTQSPIAIRGNNEDFNKFRAAQNDLLAQLQKLAEGLEPGEERILGLQVQMRRINGEVEAPSVTEDNPYRISLELPNG